MAPAVPALITKLAACKAPTDADSVLRPHVTALGVRWAEEITRIELARWLTAHLPGHPFTGKIHALLLTAPTRHDVGYYLDDPREPLKLRQVR